MLPNDTPDSLRQRAAELRQLAATLTNRTAIQHLIDVADNLLRAADGLATRKRAGTDRNGPGLAGSP